MIGKFRLYPEEDGFVSIIWLVFLLIPLITMFPYDNLNKLLAVATLVLFAVAYRNTLFEGSYYPLWMGIQYCLSLFYTFYFGYAYLFIYPAWFIGFSNLRKKEFVVYYAILMAMIASVIIGIFLVSDMVETMAQVTALVYCLFISIAPFAGRSIKKQAQLQKQLYQTNQRLESVIKQEERQRIARDLHDSLGQSLSIMTLKTELASKLIDKQPETAKEELKETASLSRSTLQTVRDIVSSMRTILIVEEMVTIEQSLRAAKIILSTTGEALTTHIPIPVQNELSYCLRECITNTIRHSQATHCSIHISETAEEMIFAIQDNGIGMKQAAFGNGTTGLKERVAKLQGTVAFTTKKGLLVTVSIPKLTQGETT